jgi:hypothetical protein
MSTELQVEANRRNAEKSTGPRTEEGKRNSSINAIKHGFCSGLVLLPNESEEVFSKTVANVYQRLQPEEDIEFELFERIVAAIWRLKRIGFVETQLYEMFMGSCSYTKEYRFPYANAFLSMCREDLPNKITRYEHAIESSLYKALKLYQELVSMRFDQNTSDE